MSAIGITGHQSLPPASIDFITAGIRRELADASDPLVGWTSLAAGADQLFADLVIEARGRIAVVLPCENYEASFTGSESRQRFTKFMSEADDVVTLAYSAPSEEAFFMAGQEVVRRIDSLIAVWDGQPSRGLGGTADVVGHARAQGKPVVVIWPAGISR